MRAQFIFPLETCDFLSVMRASTIRALTLGYAVAAAGAVALFLMGAALVACILVFWIGGALAVLALSAARAMGGGADRPGDDDAEEASMFMESLRRWEEDRFADLSPDEGAERDDAPRPSGRAARL